MWNKFAYRDVIFLGSHTKFLNTTVFEIDVRYQYTRDDGITLNFTNPPSARSASREYCAQPHRIQLGYMTCALALKLRMH